MRRLCAVLALRVSLVSHATPLVLEECAQKEAENVPSVAFEPRMPGYRLGDCISFCKCFFTAPFPESIGAEYSSCCGKGDAFGCRSNYTQIFQSLRKRDGRPGFERPEADALVIHLRLGDKIEKANQHQRSTALTHGFEEKLVSHGKHLTPSSIKGIPELLEDARASGASHVYIVAGTHQRFAEGGGKLSYVYMQCAKRALEGEGYRVTMRVGGDPDIDFYFMARARKFVVSAGGYSRHLGNLVRMQGGELVGRTFGETAY